MTSLSILAVLYDTIDFVKNEAFFGKYMKVSFPTKLMVFNETRIFSIVPNTSHTVLFKIKMLYVVLAVHFRQSTAMLYDKDRRIAFH